MTDNPKDGPTMDSSQAEVDAHVKNTAKQRATESNDASNNSGKPATSRTLAQGPATASTTANTSTPPANHSAPVRDESPKAMKRRFESQDDGPSDRFVPAGITVDGMTEYRFRKPEKYLRMALVDGLAARGIRTVDDLAICETSPEAKEYVANFIIGSLVGPKTERGPARLVMPGARGMNELQRRLTTEQLIDAAKNLVAMMPEFGEGADAKPT